MLHARDDRNRRGQLSDQAWHVFFRTVGRFPTFSPLLQRYRDFSKKEKLRILSRFHPSSIRSPGDELLRQPTRLWARRSAWEALPAPCKYWLILLGSLVNFTSYLIFSRGQEAQIKLLLSSSSGKEESTATSSIQWCPDFVITEGEKCRMGLLINDFLLSGTLWKLSISSFLLGPRGLEYSYPLFLTSHILQR